MFGERDGDLCAWATRSLRGRRDNRFARFPNATRTNTTNTFAYRIPVLAKKSLLKPSHPSQIVPRYSRHTTTSLRGHTDTSTVQHTPPTPIPRARTRETNKKRHEETIMASEPPSQDLSASQTSDGEESLTPLEQEVLDEYARLLGNLNTVRPSLIFLSRPLSIVFFHPSVFDSLTSYLV